MAKRGIVSPHIEIYTKGTKDMRSEITKIMNDPSDTMLIVAFTPEYAVFMKQAQDLGLKKTLIALSPIQAPDVAAANKGTDLKLYYAHPSATESPSAQAFLKAYREKDPSASEMSPVYLGSGYDGVKVLAHAIAECNENISCAQKSISDLSEYPGANGAITFGDKGNINNAGSMEIRVLMDGAFSKVQ